MREIKKILIANRGEIALRVVKTCIKMGIKTVGIFSEVDKDSPLLDYVDEQILIGPAPSNKSYLNQDLIIEKALELKVDAIHPGYGFLSENALFAEKVIQAGIIFIGPSPKSIEIMGNKLSAKKTVSKFDIPLVPGLNDEIKDVDKAMLAAEKIGFPVLIKASAGGGGKGMRIVHEKKDFKQQMKRAVSEAENSFGNGAVFIEKYLSKPRHIEIQILADQHGNVVHLFERDCSIQRRHQKIVEEAPSSVVSEKLRAIMGEAACNVARSCNYYGAGTVEFIFENNSFYFLEMNTRLQVEHPVTEMVTSIDLVKKQIQAAQGEKINLKQEEIEIKGHSIECRINAEHPETFIPSPGKITQYHQPGGLGVRVDSAVYQGYSIPPHYDSMISKLITYGDSRNDCIQKMKRALEEYVIIGIDTNIQLHQKIIQSNEFISGNYNINYMSKFDL